VATGLRFVDPVTRELREFRSAVALSLHESK